MESNQETQRSVMSNLVAREGVMADHTWRYWKATAKVEASEVGLPSGIDKELIPSNGTKRLVVSEHFETLKNIGNQVSNLIIENSFPYLKKKLRFIPNAKIDEVRQQLDTKIAQANLTLNNLIAEWPQIREEGEARWLAYAQNTRREDGTLVIPEDEQELFMRRIRAQMPTAQSIREKAEFAYSYFTLSVPEEIELVATDIEEHHQIAEARREMIQAEARKQAREAEQLVEASVRTLRERVVKLSEEAANTMRTGRSKVSDKTLSKLRNHFDKVRSLNFMQDQQLDNLIEQFESQFLGTSAEEYRSNDDALDALRTGMNTLATEARELADGDANEVAKNFGSVGRRRIQLQGEHSA